MEATLKIGGSLMECPASLRTLCLELSMLAQNHRILVVPGGGRFADQVRDLDQRFGLPDIVAHEMAILAMDQFGLFLSSITPNSRTTYVLKETKSLSKTGTLPIFLPSRLMFRMDPLEHSWDVTSDSIAACIADKLNVKKLILVTDVDGIFTDDPKINRDANLMRQVSVNDLLRLEKRTSVDKSLPKILKRTRMDCYVANGKFPKRIKALLENDLTVCTRIDAQDLSQK